MTQSSAINSAPIIVSLLDSWGEGREWSNGSEKHRMEAVTRMLADQWPVHGILPQYILHYTHSNADLIFAAIHDGKIIGTAGNQAILFSPLSEYY